MPVSDSYAHKGMEVQGLSTAPHKLINVISIRDSRFLLFDTEPR